MNDPNKKKSLPRVLLPLMLEVLALFLIVYGYLILDGGAPDDDTLLFRPVPDAAEQAYVSRAFALGQNPLLPIVNELHPSRFSPVHPLLMSLWIRLNAGNFNRIFQWSPLAILLGMLLLYILLVKSGAAIPVRIMSAYLILYTPLLLSTSGKILQESTMFLLFAGVCITWYMGMLLYKTSEESGPYPRCEKGSWLFSLLSGLFCGALISVRLTIFPLAIFLMIHAIWIFPIKKAWKPCLAFFSGHLIIIVSILVYMKRTAGIFSLERYSHWMGGYSLFAFAHALKPPVNCPDGTPNYLLIIREILGIQKTMVVWGWPSMVLLLVFGVAGFLIPQRPGSQDQAAQKNYRLFRSLLFFLFLFGFSQIVIHLFYFFFDARFFILSYPIIVLCGLAGWWDSFRFLYHTLKMKKLLIVIPAVLAGLVFAGGYNVFQGYDILTSYKKGSPSLSPVLREKFIHEKYRSRVRRLSCPLFVDKLPVLNARLLLDLEESPFPIAPLTREENLYFESHTVQFLWYKVGSAAGYLDDASIWKGNPAESYLFDQETGRLRREFLEALLNHYGKIQIYFPSWRRKDLAGFFRSLKNPDWKIANLSCDPGWRLVLVMKNRTPDAP